jgi:Cu/Ag efflux protein CusF
MNRIVVATVVIAFAVLGIAGTALAQMKALTGETQTISATVEAINVTTRTLTMKGPKGNFMDIVVPEAVKRFSEIKVGDTLTARYYENLVIRKKLPGEKDVDTAAEGVTPGGTAKPAGTAAKQRTITATITALDPKVPSITLSGPNKWTYSARIEDKKVLDQVKVGDKVDLTWTEALLLEFELVKK